MKLSILFFLSFLLSINLYAQDFEYKKDLRSQRFKEDTFNSYQSEIITQLDIIRALEFGGIKIHKVPLMNFEKKYKLIVSVDEYVDGKKIETKNIFQGDNTYLHFTDSIPTDSTIPYVDYIDQLLFYMKDAADHSSLSFNTYAMTTRHQLNKNNIRENQFYNWRSYSKTNWILNENIPLLVYASSWFDNLSKIERFCGIVDLSMDEKDTKELLDNSPHYYIISYKVYE